MLLSALGDSALVLSLGEEVDNATASRVSAVTDALRQAALPGVLDVVPAFATVTVHYDIAHTGPYAEFETRIREIAGRAAEAIRRLASPRVVEVPVCYGGEYGPDLELVAQKAKASLSDVIEWHSDAEYRVHAIGFVPGFAYLGGLPSRMHTPRRATPRAKVPAGSVGIGGAQTGIYPIVTPGGWNLIGRTPLVLFDPQREHPTALRTGDLVKFKPIAPEEFVAWK